MLVGLLARRWCKSPKAFVYDKFAGKKPWFLIRIKDCWLCIPYYPLCVTYDIKAPVENKATGLAHQLLVSPCDSSLKSGSSLRSPPGYSRASTPQKNQSLPTVLLCALTSDFNRGCPPPPSRSLCQRVNLQLQFIKFLVILPFNSSWVSTWSAEPTTLTNYAWAANTHSRRCLGWGTFRYSRGRLRPT